MESIKTYLVFSTITGDVIKVPEDELKHLQQTQVVLCKPFPRSCKKCFGRGYVGFDVKTQRPKICWKCMRKCLHKDQPHLTVNQ